MAQLLLDGMDDITGRPVGSMEQSTIEFAKEYRTKHETCDAATLLTLQSMIVLARNIDTLVAKGREISRNMSTLLDYIKQLQEQDAAVKQADSKELTEIYKAMSL